MARFEIGVYSHSIVVSGFDLAGKGILLRFIEKRLLHFVFAGMNKVTGRPESKPGKIFGGAFANRRQMTFHVNTLPWLLDYLDFSGCRKEDIVVTHYPKPVPMKCEFKSISGKIPTEDQSGAIDYLSAPNETIKLLTTQTGSGKTLMALRSMVNLGLRTAIVLRAGYMEKWAIDLNEEFELAPSDVMLIKGEKSLIAAIRDAIEGKLVAKVLVISNRTLYAFLDDYEKSNGDSDKYLIPPIQLFETLKVGYRIIDETHQDFHFNFRLDCYTNIQTTTDLSATMVSSDSFINRMYKLRFPLEIRFKGMQYDKYIRGYCLFYRLYSAKSIRYIRRGMNAYSHVDFEKSIMKNKKILRAYVNMILDLVTSIYVENHEKGQRAIVFAATIDFCTILTNEINARHPELAVGRYVEDDPYETLFNSDIIVSTQMSAGTAVDIPGLRYTIMTNAIDSRQSNEQLLGRLRRLKNWPNVTPEFYYLTCADIDAHLRYHRSKTQFFKDKVLSLTEMNLRGGI